MCAMNTSTPVSPTHTATTSHNPRAHQRTSIQAPATLSGTVSAIASKSVAHRALVCAAFADKPTELICNTTSQDIEATLSCVQALGAHVARTNTGCIITPVDRTKLIQTDALPDQTQTEQTPFYLDCNESGSTLRFILPVVCALGITCELTGAGRLAARPLSPLYEELQRAGITLSEQGHFPLLVSGSLMSYDFTIAGNISSQYISGLLMAAPLSGHEVHIQVTHPIESAPYIDITLQVLNRFGITVDKNEGSDSTTYLVRPQNYQSPGAFTIEGDWSNAAFWLCAQALLSQRTTAHDHDTLTVSNLSLESSQGDKAILEYLRAFGASFEATPLSNSENVALTCNTSQLKGTCINVEACPDLVPPLAVVAACAHGTTHIEGAGRLRLKESDRIESVSQALQALGVKVDTGPDSLVIEGAHALLGGTVDAANDHRIAMLAGIASICATGTVEIEGSECVAKSYPAFFETLARLGARVSTREE